MTILDPMTPLTDRLVTDRPVTDPARSHRAGPGLRALLATGAAAEIVTCAPAELADVLAGRVGPGPDLVVALDTRALGDEVLATPDAHDPLVLRTEVRATGCGPLAGRSLRVDRAVPVRLPAGPVDRTDTGTADGADIVLAMVGPHPVAVERHAAGRRVVVLGTDALLHDDGLPVDDNAVLVAHACGAGGTATASARVRSVVPARAAGAAPAAGHPAPWVVELHGAADHLAALAPPAGTPVDDPAFLRAVAHAGRHLPAALHDALVDLADAGHPSGALLVRGLPVGDVPATPPSPRAAVAKDRVSEFVLLAAARRLGQPVGYAPEHGGELVQNLVPTQAAAGAQTSTSSAVMLEFHTEAAFHPHLPRFLLLLGLRADPFGEARTLLCSVDAVLDHLSLGARAVLRQPRFRTGADESYTGGGRTGRLGHPMPVLRGDPERPSLTFDADLMTGTDPEAAAALEELRGLVHPHHIGVALGAGDLLVVDNHAAVHGRSPFRARYDGTDRWLQRSFVVADLAPSAGERRGRVVTTRFTP